MKQLQPETKFLLIFVLIVVIAVPIIAAARGEINFHQTSKPKNCVALLHQEQDKLSADASEADQEAAYQADTNAFELCDTGEGQ